jgi:hypothetical protein
MTAAELMELQDATVVLHLKDGEVLRAKIAYVNLEYDDVIVDVLETNRPEHYKDSNASYTVRASDVASAQKVLN